MTSVLTKKQWSDIVEHFAYRTSKKCMKLEDFKQFISSNYSWNPCTLKSQVVWIFSNFVKNSKKLLNGIQPYSNVKTFHFIQEEYDNVKYLIHVFKTNYHCLS